MRHVDVDVDMGMIIMDVNVDFVNQSERGKNVWRKFLLQILSHFSFHPSSHLLPSLFSPPTP